MPACASGGGGGIVLQHDYVKSFLNLPAHNLQFLLIIVEINIISEISIFSAIRNGMDLFS
jgi:hypothetical protein